MRYYSKDILFFSDCVFYGRPDSFGPGRDFVRTHLPVPILRARLYG